MFDFIRGSKKTVQSHEHYMQRALELAARGSGCTSPNPLVGSIVVRDGVILGEGWHEEYGQAHAEVNALRNAITFLESDNSTDSIPTAFASDGSSQFDNSVLASGSLTRPNNSSIAAGKPESPSSKQHQATNTKPSASPPLHGATLYVTLEPCNHQGATPPCTRAVVEAGIKHVVYALSDPNPKAAGGADWLRSQGVTVTQGILEEQATFINRFFLKHVKSNRPYVIAKSASSLDGKIATRTGNSQWITGPAARQRGHELRQAVDAILVGADTVIADNPSLTVRLPEALCPAESIRHPRPIILDTHGRVPLSANLLNAWLPTNTLILTTQTMDPSHREAIESHGHEVVALEKNVNGIGISPESIVKALGERGIQSVLLEGGASVHGSFRDAGLIDEIWTFIAPTIIGGKEAPAAFSATGSDALAEATKLHDIRIEQVGDDILIRGCVSPFLTNEQR